MDAYPNSHQRRILLVETQEMARRKYGLNLVNGLDRVVDPGSAATATQGSAGGPARMAGFTVLPNQEWLLPLPAGKPLVWRTSPVSASDCKRVGLVFSAGFGNGSPLPQPSGQWDVYCNGRRAVSIRVVKHSQLWRGDECSLAFSAHRIEAAPPFGSLCLSSLIKQESFAAFGMAILSVPAEWVEANQPAEISVVPTGTVPSTRWFQIVDCPMIMPKGDIYRALEVLEGATRRAGDRNVYFGDIHTHSGQMKDEIADRGCGIGSREDNYAYARGPGGLDFYSLTDHEYQVDPDKAGEYFDLADKHNRPGRFVCLPGYEFTSLLYGHRNVYFSDSSGRLVASTHPHGPPTFDPALAVSPERLWQELDAGGVDYITVPHHTNSTSHPCSLDFYNPRRDRLVEVYSCWGSSEYYGDQPRGISDRYRTLTVRDALARGLRFGMIASSDGHDGHPGDAQSPLVKHHHIFHHLGSGLTAVLADELTRPAVFDALQQRRCYATTGTPIMLGFEVDGRPMGSELSPLPAGRRAVLRIDCRGTNGIDHVRIVRNGQVVHTAWRHGEWDAQLEWEDPIPCGDGPTYYYIRVVQVDGESAWSSPVWIG